ncbi:MAG TPA: hypothetical protein VM433_13390 [Mycobacteriales bacterium]|nr:hypothetical protein [Mycobacteriales bacterium]
MTSGTSGSPRVPHVPVAVPAPPKGGAPAGSLPPGSAPAVGWAAHGPRVADRPETRRGETASRPGSKRSRLESALAEAAAAEPTTAELAIVGDPAPAPWDAPRVPRPARRQNMLLQGVGPAAVALALTGAALLGTVWLALAVLVLQLFLILAVLALMDAPAAGGAFLVAAGAVVAADVAVVVFDGDIRGLAGVVALALVASLLHQLTRRTRSRVTESMADTLVAVTVGVSAACLVSLRELEGGEQTVRVALLAAGASLLAARIGDRLASRPMLAIGSTRGWPGLLLGLGAGVAAAVLVAGDDGVVVGSQAALLGLVCAATVAAADLAVDLGAAELRAGRRDARRVEALKPSNLLLPFALLGPISLVAGQLVLG